MIRDVLVPLCDYAFGYYDLFKFLQRSFIPFESTQ